MSLPIKKYSQGYDAMPGGLELSDERRFEYPDEKGIEQSSTDYFQESQEEEPELYDKYEEFVAIELPIYKIIDTTKGAPTSHGQQSGVEVTDEYSQIEPKKNTIEEWMKVYGASLIDLLSKMAASDKTSAGYIAVMLPHSYKKIDWGAWGPASQDEQVNIFNYTHNGPGTFEAIGVGPLQGISYQNDGTQKLTDVLMEAEARLRKIIPKEYSKDFEKIIPHSTRWDVPEEIPDEYDEESLEVPMGADIERVIGSKKPSGGIMILKKILALSNRLDAAGLTKEADLLDKIAQMDDWSREISSEDWEGEDALENSPSDFGTDEDWSDEIEPAGNVEGLVAQLEAFKGMIEEGLVDQSQLDDLQQQIEALQNLYLGGGPSMFTGEAPQPADAWGGSMELGGEGISPEKMPVAEASQRTRLKKLKRKMA